MIFLGVVGAGGGLLASGIVWAILRMINYYLVPGRYKALHDALRVKSFNVEFGAHNTIVTRITFTSSNEEYARLLAEANQVKVEY